MNPKLITTEDGSHTLFLKELGEQYHSVHGAITESKHVFIDKAFDFYKGNNLTVFEVGFGTGLNCLLTAIEASGKKKSVHYISIEKYPLSREIINQLNYPEILATDASDIWKKIHAARWNKETYISDYFKLLKLKLDITRNTLPELPLFNIIYFDAFAPGIQPEMWTSDIFSLLFNLSQPGAVLTTYSAKGSVRRMLAATGFKMERLPGPPGKKEMLRGIKTH